MARVAVVVLAATGVQAGTMTAAAADPPRADWAKLRMCESSDRYHINTGSGYYGAYQFDLPTWRSVGGEGRPDQASPKEQDFRALYLYRMRGWQPWECANREFLDLADDADARTKRVPTYAESAYIGGTGQPAPAPEPPPEPDPGTGPSTMPTWPGVVYAYGDCATELKAFQLRMNHFDLDHTFQGTGCYYEQTKIAVLALQRANGINDSGRLGPKTWKAAWHGKPPA
ncbi:MAG: transglycosylase [Actinophytocola sp.]|nr:transglycosylase [Actinophytocola sp.]